MIDARFVDDIPGWAIDLIASARPECGYRCDGGDGDHPANGSPGCFYSGRAEP